MPARCSPRSRSAYAQKRIHPRHGSHVSTSNNRCLIDCRITREGRVRRTDLPTAFHAKSIELAVILEDTDTADLYASGVRPHRPLERSWREDLSLLHSSYLWHLDSRKCQWNMESVQCHLHSRSMYRSVCQRFADLLSLPRRYIQHKRRERARRARPFSPPRIWGADTGRERVRDRFSNQLDASKTGRPRRFRLDLR